MKGLRSTGLAVLAVLSLLDLSGPLLTDGEHPPMGVALVAAAFGLASLVLLGYVARGASRALLPLVVLRVLSALSAVPAFFVDPGAGVLALAGGIIALTAVGVALVLARAPRTVVTAR